MRFRLNENESQQDTEQEKRVKGPLFKTLTGFLIRLYTGLQSTAAGMASNRVTAPSAHIRKGDDCARAGRLERGAAGGYAAAAKARGGSVSRLSTGHRRTRNAMVCAADN